MGGVPLLFSFSIDSFFSELMVSDGHEVSGWPSGSQWAANADSFRIICFSQWVACT